MTSRQEIDDLREIVKRDLADAGIDVLSDDRKFATAYNAVLQLSKMAIACSGYRVTSGAGHHQKTFDVIRTALASPEAEDFADYFDTCRRKRNYIDYDGADIVTETEAGELVEKANEFHAFVEDWISREHPTLKV
jgi:hypothetical protein